MPAGAMTADCSGKEAGCSMPLSQNTTETIIRDEN